MLLSKRMIVAAAAGLALGGGQAFASSARAGQAFASSARAPQADPASAPRADPASAPRASLRSFVCQRALDPPTRAVSTTAVMRPLPGTEQMALKFQLQVRHRRRGPFVPVKGGDLGKWVSPGDPTLGRHPADVWVLAKPVVDLPAPAFYRFRVSFRWRDASRVIGLTVRHSPICHQPELRPDLTVGSIAVKPAGGQPGQDRYTAVIRNAGTTAAGRFAVELAGAGIIQSQEIKSLRPHSSRTVTFLGAACSPSNPPTVTVDPMGSVNDYNRSNNTLRARCVAG